MEQIMTPSRMLLLLIAVAVAGLLLGTTTPALAMGTSFSYQGSLEDGGVPANGSYDFEFNLIDSGGSTIAINRREDVEVVQGVFTVALDYGSGVNPFPGGFVRYLEIGIRPADSTGPYEYLSPLTQIRPTPYAQRAAQVSPAGIDEASLAAGIVSTGKLANNAVTTGKLDDDSVSSAKMADGAVTSAKLASSAVSNAKLANNAVNNAKVAANTLTMSRHAGVFFDGSIGSLAVGAGACIDFNIPISGALAGDFPLIALQPSSNLPGSLSLTAVRVPSNGVMELRACNAGNSTASWNSLNLIFMTLR
jgi:hypothetical protein